MGGTLRYEWRRISSIRSTWFIALLAGVVTAGICALIIFIRHAIKDTLQTDPGAAPSDAEFHTVSFATWAVLTVVLNPVLLVLLGTMAAQAFGQEYRHGTIRLTLTAFPRRLPVFVSKVLVCCAAITVIFLVATLVASLAFMLDPATFSRDLESDALLFLIRGWAFLMGFSVMVFGLTLMTRILALGIVIPLVVLAIEFIFVPIVTGFQVLTWLPKALPFTSGFGFVLGEDTLRNGLVFAAWSLVPLVLGLALFERRDA